jgi:hypothetical protein
MRHPHGLRAAAGAGTPGPVEYVTQTNLESQTSDETRTLTISSGFNVGDVIIAMVGNRTGTAPSLLSGYTGIIDVDGIGSTQRSMRLQYKISTSPTESITWTGAYGWMLVLRNFTAIGQSAGLTQTSFGTSVPLPAISGLDTSGRGYLIATTFLSSLISNATSPFSFLSPFGGFIANNTLSSVSGSTLSVSSSAVFTSAVVEVL